jgi:predicted secreted protein
MSVAAHTIKVYTKATSATPGAGDEIDGINDTTYNELVALLETTDIKDSSGWRTRMAGLADSKVSLAGDYESGDAPQALLRSSKRSGATVYITIHFDPNASTGLKGVQVPMLVESFDVKDSLDGKSAFSASLAGNGAVVDV